MKNYAFVFALILTAAVHAAAPDARYKTPRTGEGQPDLQGLWNFSSDVPLERPAKFADRKVFTKAEIEQLRIAKDKALQMIASFAPVEDIGLTLLDHTSYVQDLRTSLIIYAENGRLPKLVDGVRRLPGPEQILAALEDIKGGPPPELLAALGGDSAKNSVNDFSATARCLIGGAPAPLLPDLDDNYVQIIQSRDYIALLSDVDRRLAPLDGRPHPSKKIRTWSGDSRAHWDGETLVIETQNFNNRTRSFSGAGTAEEKIVTERFTRQSAKLLDYEATIVDPKTFQDKVVISFPMARVEGRVYENACHEHNYSLANALSAARKAGQ
jgi:hypothetical protein